MSVLYLLIPIGIVFLFLAVLFFFWAIKNGQYDDMESQALKIVIEDHQSKPNKSKTEKTGQNNGSEEASIKNTENKNHKNNVDN